MPAYQPNLYALAWDALRIYREEMRAFVVGNLQSKFGDLWMAQGVDRHFKIEEIDGLRRILGQRARPGQVVAAHAESFADMLDVSHFRTIIEANWSSVFRPVLGDRAILDSWIAEITTARNALAHWQGGDLPRKDALRVVDTCERVVRSVNLERADEVRQIWDMVDARGRDEPVSAHRATVVFEDGSFSRATLIFDQALPVQPTEQ